MLKKEPKYILQEEDNTCTLITLLNLIIHKTGKSPIKYKSEKFNLLFKKHCMTDFAVNELNLKRKESPKFKSINRFKNWIINNLRKGDCIDFYLRHENIGGSHSILMVGYNQQKDSFKVINAQLFTTETPIEYISWGELTTQCYLDKKHAIKYKMPYYNKKEETSLTTRSMINGTSIIKLKK